MINNLSIEVLRQSEMKTMKIQIKEDWQMKTSYNKRVPQNNHK